MIFSFNYDGRVITANFYEDPSLFLGMNDGYLQLENKKTGKKYYGFLTQLSNEEIPIKYKALTLKKEEKTLYLLKEAPLTMYQVFNNSTITAPFSGNFYFGGHVYLAGSSGQPGNAGGPSYTYTQTSYVLDADGEPIRRWERVNGCSYQWVYETEIKTEISNGSKGRTGASGIGLSILNNGVLITGAAGGVGGEGGAGARYPSKTGSPGKPGTNGTELNFAIRKKEIFSFNELRRDSSFCSSVTRAEGRYDETRSVDILEPYCIIYRRYFSY